MAGFRRLLYDLMRHVLAHLQCIVADVGCGWVGGWFIGSMVARSFRLPDYFYIPELILWILLILIVFGTTWFLCHWTNNAKLLYRWRNNLRCRESFYCSWDHLTFVTIGFFLGLKPPMLRVLPHTSIILWVMSVAVATELLFWSSRRQRAPGPKPDASAFLPLDRIADDRLGRARIVDALSDAVQSVWKNSQRNGAIVGLKGELGIGKTTVLNFLCERLRQEYLDSGHPLVVRMEPWPIRGGAAIQRHLLYQLHSGLSTRYNLVGIQKVLQDYLHFLEKGWPDIKAFATFRAAIGSPFLSLEQEVERLRYILSQIDSRVLIIVDDLDRLLPVELHSLMRVVDHLRALPKTAFLLSYDPLVTPQNFAHAAMMIEAEIP